MEGEVVSDTTSSLVTALLEYGAMGIFAIYLILTNWFAQKRLDRVMAKSESVASEIAEQLSANNAKLDVIIESKKQDQLKKDIAKMIENKDG
jgi:flavodoxin